MYLCEDFRIETYEVKITLYFNVSSGSEKMTRIELRHFECSVFVLTLHVVFPCQENIIRLYQPQWIIMGE